jgi:hypothetical protein
VRPRTLPMHESEQRPVPTAAFADDHERLRAYLRLGRHRVRGWLKGGACTMICAVAATQSRLGVSGNAAEIGVYHGKLFILLYLLLRGDERAIAIDPFEEPGRSERHLPHFERNLQRHAGTERLVVQICDSLLVDSAALGQRVKGGFRLFSVDGCHTEENTTHDLATAEGCLVPGGVLILDDCFNPEWPSVSCAVYRHFGERRGIVPFAIGANKVLFAAPEFHKSYFDAMLALPAVKCERDYLGWPVVVLRFETRAWRRLRRIRNMTRRYLAI